MVLGSYKHSDSFDAFQDILIEGVSKLKAERDALHKQATGDLPKIEKIEQINPFAGYSSDWVSRLERELTKDAGYIYSVPPTPEALEAEGLKRLNEMKVKAEAAHLPNIPKIESNKKLTEKLCFLMKQIGMPDSYSTDEYVGRSSKRKRLNYSAGYLGDLQRNVTRDDGYGCVASGYESWKSDLLRRCKDMRTKIEEDKRKKDLEMKGTLEQQRLLEEKNRVIEELKKQVSGYKTIVEE